MIRRSFSISPSLRASTAWRAAISSACRARSARSNARIASRSLGSAGDVVTGVLNHEARSFGTSIVKPIHLVAGLLHDARTGHATGMHARPVQPFDQGRELSGRQPHDAVLDPRPAELAIIETLAHQHETSAVPDKQLHPVGALGAEHVDHPGERVRPERLLHERGEPIHALAEVDRLGCNKYPHRSGGEDHRTLFSSPMTAASVRMSTFRRRRTMAPPISISIGATSAGATAERGSSCGAELCV